jgi:hypothetical protein
MKYLLAVLVLVGLSLPVYAQAADCICVGSGCKIATAPYPLPATAQPTSCQIEKGGVVVSGSSCAIVLSTSIPPSNALVCQPSDATYNPGTTGSVTPLANIPAQPLGSVALVMKVFNSATPGGAASAPFTFNNVAALSTPLSAPTNLRVVP